MAETVIYMFFSQSFASTFACLLPFAYTFRCIRASRSFFLHQQRDYLLANLAQLHDYRHEHFACFLDWISGIHPILLPGVPAI